MSSVQTIDHERMKKKYSHLKGMAFQGYKNAVPTILLGLPHAYLTCGTTKRVGKFNEPIATYTKLGWVLFGTQEGKECHKKFILSIDSSDLEEEKRREEKDLQLVMKDYFSTEQFGVQVPTKALISQEEKIAKEIMEKTLRYENGQYEIGLLWKTNNTTYPDSFQTALKRLTRNENAKGAAVGIMVCQQNKGACIKGIRKKIRLKRIGM